MPFALPEYDAAFGRFVGDILRELAKSHSPMLAQIQFLPMSSTTGSRVRSREGMDLDLAAEPSETTFVMAAEEVRTTDVAAFATQMDSAAADYAEQLVQRLVATMGEITEATGNVVSSGGPITFDSLYEALEKIDFSLDENDELVMPSLVMHPATAATLPDLTPDQEEKLADLKARKLEEALARRRRRRLS